MNELEIKRAIAEAVGSGDEEAELSARRQLKAFMERSQPFEFSASKMVSNIPGSAKEAGSQILGAVAHPIDTATSLYRFSRGLAEKLWPGEQDYEQYADAVGRMIVDRYGSTDAALRSLQEDPVGVALDVSTVVTGGAGLARGAAKLTGMNRAAQTLGKVQAVTDPVNLVKRGVQKTAAHLRKRGAPNDMYAGAAKMSTTIPELKRAAAVQTALDNQIMPTPKGLKKLEGKMRLVGRRIDSLLERARETGQTVAFDDVARPLRELRAQWANSPVPERPGDVKKITKYLDDWSDQLGQQGRTRLTVDDLQKIKTELYDKIKWDRKGPGEMAVEEMRKAAAKGARESIEDYVPEIKGVNRLYGDLEHLKGALDRPVSRIQNRDMVGIGVPIKATAGAMLGGDYGLLGGATGGMLGMLDAPTNKARLALALHRWRNQPIATPTAFPFALGAYQAGGLPSPE